MAANRQRFVANEREYLDGWPTTSEQEQAVLETVVILLVPARARTLPQLRYLPRWFF